MGGWFTGGRGRRKNICFVWYPGVLYVGVTSDAVHHAVRFVPEVARTWRRGVVDDPAPRFRHQIVKQLQWETVCRRPPHAGAEAKVSK